MSPNELAMMFISKNDCDEVRFQYSKSKRIHIHSFCFGDDFNFMVCTNNQITLYNLNLFDHKPKTVEKIDIPYLSSIAASYFEPMACTLFLVDNSGQCVVFFLNMHSAKSKEKHGLLLKHFNLEISQFAEDELI